MKTHIARSQRTVLRSRLDHGHLFQRLVAVVLLGIATSADSLGQTWSSEQVILPGSDPASATVGIGRAVLVNPFGSTPAPGVFVGLSAASAGTATILRLTPVDAASTAFTRENLDSALTSASGLAYNPVDGVLYAAGYAPIDPGARNTTYRWKVRKSANQGNTGTWSEDDSFTLAKSAYSAARKVAVDPSGRVFVAGVAKDGKGSPHWVVRRQVPGGAWATVFDAKGNNINMLPSVGYFPGNPANPAPAMFTTSDVNSKWTVMRSQSQGEPGSWEQVDSWTGGGAEAAAYDIACDRSNGHLYVVGCRGLNGKNPSAWVIRTSTDGGNTWSTLLDIAGTGSWASMAAVDPSGSVSVAGVVNPSGGRPLWKIIRCTTAQDPAGWAASYESPDTVPFGSSTYSKGAGIAADAFGNVFATGGVTDWADSTVSPPTTYPGERVGLLRLVLMP